LRVQVALIIGVAIKDAVHMSDLATGASVPFLKFFTRTLYCPSALIFLILLLFKVKSFIASISVKSIASPIFFCQTNYKAPISFTASSTVATRTPSSS